MKRILYLIVLIMTVSCVHEDVTSKQRSRQIVIDEKREWRKNYKVIYLDSIPDVECFLQTLDAAIYYDREKIEAYYLKDEICSSALKYKQREAVLLSLLKFYPHDTDMMYALAQNYYITDKKDLA